MKKPRPIRPRRAPSGEPAVPTETAEQLDRARRYAEIAAEAVFRFIGEQIERCGADLEAGKGEDAARRNLALMIAVARQCQFVLRSFVGHPGWPTWLHWTAEAILARHVPDRESVDQLVRRGRERQIPTRGGQRVVKLGSFLEQRDHWTDAVLPVSAPAPVLPELFSGLPKLASDLAEAVFEEACSALDDLAGDRGLDKTASSVGLAAALLAGNELLLGSCDEDRLAAFAWRLGGVLAARDREQVWGAGRGRE